jgi:N-acetylneuraminate lyase
MNDRESARDLLTGLVAATFTPMCADGALNLAAVPAVTDFVLGQRVNGLFLCGSTGEGPSLTVTERMAVSEAYLAANSGRVPVVVQVGHNSLEDSRDLAEHAARSGADAIAVVPPSYFPTASLDVLVESLQRIAEAAPDTPLYYYHIPRISGVGVRMVALLERADHALPTFAGIKFSSFEFDDLICCVHHRHGHYNILFGSDEMLLAGLATGAAGAVGSTYNFLGPRYGAVIDAFRQGRMDEARRHQYAATRIVHAILRHGGANAIKASMNVLGVDCGPARLPLKTLSADQVTRLRADLERTMDTNVSGDASS